MTIQRQLDTTKEAMMGRKIKGYFADLFSLWYQWWIWSYDQLLLLPQLMNKMLAENITERERYARGRAVLVLQEPGRVAWFQGEIYSRERTERIVLWN